MKKDQLPDRLLERASTPGSRARPQGVCVDAETLAAWTEGSLSTNERAAAELHAADCERCLAILAAVAKTTPPPSEVQRPAWLSVRWMLPLTTAAAAVIGIVLVQEPREAPPDLPSAPPAPVLPTPPAVQQAPAATPADEPERDVTARTRTDAVEKKEAAPPVSVQSPQPESRRDTRAAAKEAADLDRLARNGLVPLRKSGVGVAAPVIVSPDPDVRWRLTGTSVERSIDRGRTWTAQTTGTDVPLLAGASPDPAVCWIVGRRGVVLLSTEGEAWRRVEFPDPKADLVTVSAVDARSATVTTADGRSYRTDDGGRSWTLQEKSEAAF